MQAELGDELDNYSKLFKEPEEILADIESIKDALFNFNLENAEIFADQLNQIDDRKTVLEIKKALANAKELYNLIRMQGDYELLKEIDFERLNRLYREACNRLDLLNLKESIEKGSDADNLLNIALEDIVFKFIKTGEEELLIADELRETLRKTREAMQSNIDQQDPRFISLKEELERLFKKKNLSKISQEEMATNITMLNKIHQRVKELNRKNDLLRQKYRGDQKYARIHKRLQERGGISDSERRIFGALNGVKQDADEQVLQNTRILDNEGYFERQMMPLVIKRFKQEQNLNLDADASRYINHLVINEYLKEFNVGMAI